jgi:HSP20 family protein
MFYTATLPALRRWSHPVAASRSLERFLDEAFAATRLPGASFAQDDKAFTLSFDLPGVAREHLSIAIEDTVVRIATKEDAPRQYKAAYELPQDIDAGISEAKLENGVLTLKLVKKLAESKATELTIQ